jgi:hypothetical protein
MVISENMTATADANKISITVRCWGRTASPG